MRYALHISIIDNDIDSNTMFTRGDRRGDRSRDRLDDRTMETAHTVFYLLFPIESIMWF